MQARTNGPTVSIQCKLLKIMVGTIGFEPTTSSVSKIPKTVTHLFSSALMAQKAHKSTDFQAIEP
jgi:hypothetical protein